MLPCVLTLGVELGKRCLGHIDLSPDNHLRGCIWDEQRDGTDRSCLLSRQLAEFTIPAGGRLDQMPVQIVQDNGQAVYLWLKHIPYLVKQLLPGSLVELFKLSWREGIVQAQQRQRVFYGKEGCGRCSSYPLRR